MDPTTDNLCKESTFNTFYTKQVQAVSNFAFYKCGDKDHALDLVQDAFSKIWQNCSKIDYTKAKTYLFTTVNNLFLNTIKHKKVVLEYAKASPYIDTNNQNPEYLLEEEEFKIKLQNAIASLTDGQREVFLLNRIEGKKYREIATLLNLSQKAVEKRMSGALKALRAEIDNI
ncbi:sigma-70 family RNA polymerase sigma factor [Lacinutrix sp. C3R15]|uniref:RNA polymerase sigma factor n=1 Tax=Flavobacteriaceae TaxID=49546 RepID=UPI001C08D9C1|nr:MULTISPECIES: sigma-70 family RNA polymerase sigma factor [Flavobacteriaceae]MBU2939413.1 sigma-70 family RNA polymerase sigma factor [Lacinutrix sp. C3R15]MDO6622728.1 sigma-70 family RNA polymerase sigma factor [Oceanihabitans sp. 1_MG-2023]